jgi:crotonobetaine/carnitine-CoA ligase
VPEADNGEAAAAFWAGRVAQSPNRPVLEYDGQSWTYAEADLAADELMAIIRAAGLRPGSRIGVLLPSSAAHVLVTIAVIKAECVIVPLVPNSTDAELAYTLRASRAHALITDQRGWDRLDAAMTVVDLAMGQRAGLAGTTVPELLLAVAPALQEREPENGRGALAPAFLLYTSGSTGTPKGAVLPSGAHSSAGRAWASGVGLTSSAVLGCVLPIQYAGPMLMQLGGVIAAGARLVLWPGFHASSFWEDSDGAGATHAVLPFAVASILCLAPERPEDRAHTLRSVSGDRFPAGFARRFGISVQSTWAMTELAGMGTITSVSDTGDFNGRIGRPSPPTALIEVRNAAGRRCPTGQRGEIWFRHPHTLLGYFDDEQATGQVKRDGWVRSGDLGHFDERGELYFDARIKNVIKRSGSNIAAEEVEQVLRAHPNVVDCVVLGVDDPIRGEEVHALLQCRGDRLDPARLAEHARSAGLSLWKFPRYLQQVADLPRIPSGKVDRRSAARLLDRSAAIDFGEGVTRYNAAVRPATRGDG